MLLQHCNASSLILDLQLYFLKDENMPFSIDNNLLRMICVQYLQPRILYP